MKKAIYLTLVAAIICGVPIRAARAQEPAEALETVVITELQTAGANVATEEFVELYNLSNEPVDVTGWQLQYRAASGQAGQSWPASTTKATLACAAGSPSDCRVVINARSHLVAVHTIANIAGALPMTGGFSSTGGQVRLIQPGTTPIVHDFVGYGTAADFETAAASAPSAGKSLKRVVSAEGDPQDTNHNTHDFIADCGTPSPGQADTNPLPLTTGCTPTSDPPTEDPPGDPPTEEPPTETPATYLPLIITEVFPDPVSPQQDANDEFIELYNPHDTTITLAGYQLQTGSGFRYHHLLGDTPLGSHQYLAIPSAVSKLSLANSGSGVRLLDPKGVVVAEVPDYGPAKPGQSWIQFEGVWQWTLSPTGGMANVLVLPPPPKPPKPSDSSAKKKAATVKASTTKPPKTTKQAANQKPSESPAEALAAAPKAQEPPYWIIIPLGLSIIAYGVYEYRHQIAKGWQKLRLTFSKDRKLQDEDPA